MNFAAVLEFLRSDSLTEKEKGTRFERLIQAWLKADPTYAILTDVWLWEEFAPLTDMGNKDLGIDLVARTNLGEYWAIQCKCYREDTRIDKSDVDSFISNSSRTFTESATGKHCAFAARMWVSTTDKWGANAREATQNLQIPFTHISQEQLSLSTVDWEALLRGKEFQKRVFTPMPHQIEALAKGHEHYTAPH